MPPVEATAQAPQQGSHGRTPLPLLMSFYGDDFTGSTDEMEALTRAGLRTVLFLEPPRPEQLAAIPGLRAFGVAGRSRTMTPGVMEVELRSVLEGLRAPGAPLVHYKVCSTFDSSPEIGSIGRAIDVGASVFGSSFVPLVVGAPVLGRYCVFGNLFARSGLDSEPFRLDRHPTMRAHPITPMDESDLRLHLQKQTRTPVRLFDVLQLEAPDALARFHEMLRAGAGVVLFDTLYERHLPLIGRAIWERTDARAPLFAVGSSGLAYALTACWRETATIEDNPSGFGARRVEQMVVVSGSCSPVTDRQIGTALEQGFAEIAIDTKRLLDEAQSEPEIGRLTAATVASLANGKSVILHTARGPGDPRLQEAAARFRAMGLREADLRVRTGGILGAALGRLLDAVLAETRLPRAAVTGGDTSGFVAQALGIESLEMIAPLAPGSPLCRVRAPGRPAHGCELVFKGGQVGRTDYFSQVMEGIR